MTYWAAQKEQFRFAIVLNLLALCVFKYWNFGIENINALISLFGVSPVVNVLKFGLPLGISFFVFKHIGYLVDVEQRRYPASIDVISFLTYSAYFPQISAGPISNYKDTADHFARLPQKLEADQASEALVYVSVGLVKKILIADTLASLLSSPMNKINGFEGLIPAWYIIVTYSAQLYFDFSGYTDMVIGISKFFGITLPQNFNNPYLAANPGEFWERWHISLSQWFRNYMFFPFSRFLLRRWGSDRREQAQQTANIVTMAFVGLWHGASWNYVLWGIYHGVLLNLNALWKRSGRSSPTLAGRVSFILSILLGWALFMSPNTTYFKYLCTQLAGISGWGTKEAILSLFRLDATLVLIACVPLAFSGFSEGNQIATKANQHPRWVTIAWGILAALSLMIVFQSPDFIYVQF